MKRKFKNISKKGLIMTLCLIGIVLVLSIILMNSFSLPDQIGTISFQSKSLNYDNKEAGSFEITKSTRWISKGKARVEVNVDTISKIENGDKDIILVLDTSFGDNLVTIKKTLLDFVEKTLSNENSKIALVTYDSSSAVRVGFTKDKELLSNRINTLTTGLGKRNYYQALVSIDSILKEYQKETKEVTTIFVTNGYSNVDIENEESYYQYLKEQYPYLNMNLVWYGESIDIEKQFGKVSDKQTITSIHNLENTLLDTVDYTKAYDTFVLKDIINTEYFDSNSITNVKTSNGIVRMEKDSLIWDLEEFHTGRSSNLVFELILKENLDNEIKMVTTSKETNISYRIENEEEIINNTDIINLPTNYQVIYEENKPNGCEVENLPSNEVRQVKEVVELSNGLKCNGYNFRGWSILTEGVETLTNNQFVMPDSDVIVKAEWSKVSLEKTMEGTIQPGLPEAPVIHSNKVGYPIITEYGVMIDSEVSIDFSDRDDIDNYYSVDDGKTWKLYEGPFNRLSSKTIRAKSCLKDIDDCIESSKEIEMPTDALPPVVYDKDPSTYFQGVFDTKYINVSNEMQGKNINVINGYETYSMVFRFLNQAGEKIEEKTLTKTQVLTIPLNTTRIEIYFDGRWNINEIEIDDTPIINETKIYPIIKEYGVEVGYNEIEINYFSTSVQKLYRINGGEWQEYQNETIRLEIGDTIEAKGIDKYETESQYSQYTAVLPTDALPPVVYDKDPSTYFQGVFDTKYINVSNEMQGEKIKVISSIYSQFSSYSVTVRFINEVNEQISESGGFQGEIELIIPIGTKKLEFYFIGRHNVNEIEVIENIPTIEFYQYPVLTKDGILGSNELNITYHKTSVEKLYRINGGEWKEYTNQLLDLETGDVIEAKGINENGKESGIARATIELAPDAIGAEAYDENENTGFLFDKNKNRKMKVDSSIWRQKYSLLVTTLANNTNSIFYIRYFNKDNEEISHDMIVEDYNKKELIFIIPSETVMLEVSYESEYSYTQTIHEIKAHVSPIINEEKIYPTLTASKVISGYNNVTIDYGKLSAQKLYRVNNGEWQEYQNNAIRLEIGDTLEAKGIDEKGTETQVSIYNSILAKDALEKESYDYKEDTGDYFSRDRNKKIFVSSELWNKQYKLLVTTYANDYNSIVYIRYLNDKDEVISYDSIVEDLNKVEKIYTIPENTKSIEFKYDSSENYDQTIYEISNDSIINPNINIDNVELSANKTINITYLDGYTNEYSLDLGENWNSYTESLQLEKPTTILARSVDSNGNVVSSSSFKVTGIDNIEPEITLELPEEIVMGQDYPLPTSYKVGISGGKPICENGYTIVDNTNQLAPNNYTITCTIENGLGITKSVTKNILIKRAELLGL